MLDKIISQQGLKSSNEKIIKRLEYDSHSKKYYWIVFNTLHKEKLFSDVEILHIDTKSGEILQHFEERQYILQCY